MFNVRKTRYQTSLLGVQSKVTLSFLGIPLFTYTLVRG